MEILQLHTPLKKTLKIYREAVDWLLPVIDSEWDRISARDGPKRQFNYAEHLIHKTKDNEPDHPFDEVFPKMPSYFRRSVLQKVLGTVRSYHVWYPIRLRKTDVNYLRKY